MAPGVEWGELLEDGKRLDQACLEFPGGGWCRGERALRAGGASPWHQLFPSPLSRLGHQNEADGGEMLMGEQWQPPSFHSDGRGRQGLNGGQWLARPEGGLGTTPPVTPGKSRLYLATTVSQVFPAFRWHSIFTENTSGEKNQKDTIDLVLPLEGWRSAAKLACPKHRIGLNFQINQTNFRRFGVQREIPFTPQCITLHPLWELHSKLS